MNKRLVEIVTRALTGKALTDAMVRDSAEMPNHFQLFIAESSGYGTRTKLAKEIGYFDFPSIDDAREKFNADMRDLKEALDNPTKDTDIYAVYITMKNSLTKAVTRAYTVETTEPETEPEKTTETETTEPETEPENLGAREDKEVSYADAEGADIIGHVLSKIAVDKGESYTFEMAMYDVCKGVKKAWKENIAVHNIKGDMITKATIKAPTAE